MSIQQEIETTFALYNIELQRLDLAADVIGPCGEIENFNPLNYPAGYRYGQAPDGRWYLGVRVKHVSSLIPSSVTDPVPLVLVAYQESAVDPSRWVCKSLRTEGTLGLVASKLYEVTHCGAVVEFQTPGCVDNEKNTYTPY